ncbi:MAG: restriction endonuclease [Anaerolineae bacterium]|nr:restriction endonuclease [Anaerolineae bacterium]
MRSSGYHVNWEVVYNLLRVDSDVVDELYVLPTEQKYFLLSLVSLDIREFTPSNKVAKHTRSVYKVRLTTKNLVKDILEPLEVLGLIETRKVTTGRGAKPHEVKLTEKGQTEILHPIIENLASLSELTSSEVDRPFEEVVAELSHLDKHVKGKALEIFAVWIIRLLGLRFSHWRLKSYQATGGGEVDVIAASDKIVYSRWQIQCKNMRSAVDIDVIAKEVGLTFMTKADVVMVITTSQFTRNAVNFANQVTDNSRYYVILLEKEDIDRIVEDKAVIVDILNYKARRTFAKRELGVSDLGDELFDDEQPESMEEIEAAIEDASEQNLLTPLDNGDEQELVD